ncbi:hypothetical protein HYE82_12325 [Streptomyces sp. BR123]|uniref:hypothetical protein n=1 Tax=Streptomyces sp. BR123 TaxID=2749828 RepID=UPI0015C46210|nr:hypothetical protein [Streptomyces sp. BR123]NXY95164.1 hypothetical protein [Streptomyces sp. BR123]
MPVGLGLTGPSAAPASLPGVRAALAAHTLAACRELAEPALLADDTDAADDARRAVRSGIEGR